MTENEIYALKVDQDRRQDVFRSLKEGVARFGWSYVPTADLRKLRQRIEESGRDSLSSEELDCYQAFLLDVKEGDWVVYINVPEYGSCTAALVKSPYYWEWLGDDFNHRLRVDAGSVFVFDRNDQAVHPALSARLKLQGRHWRIYAKSEFFSLVQVADGGGLGKPATEEHSLELLGQEIRPLIARITERIHHTHPNYALESLIAYVLRGMPAVREVRLQGGRGDNGADVIAIVESPHPITGRPDQKTFVIQVKSFAGVHEDLRAVEDIRRAFDKYPYADEGIIFSTAALPSSELEEAVERLEQESGRPVQLMIGEDVAGFFLRNGWELLG